MKHALTIACLLTACGAYAQEEVPLEPKAPKTASEASMLINDAARTANELKEVGERVKSNERATAQLSQRMKKHNERYPGGVCTYTEENPTACDPWVAESKALNSQMDYLINEHEQALIEQMELKGYMNMRLARLRIMKLLSGLTEWEQEVVRCATQNSAIGAQACMASAWERHP